MNGYELAHHGIKGQKWGVRRFQNEDGSLTPRGQKRYSENGDSSSGSGTPQRRIRGFAGGANPGDDPSSMSDSDLRSRVSRMEMERRYRNLTAPKQESTLETARKVTDQSSQLINRVNNNIKIEKPQKQRMKLDDMSDKELRDRINRELLERQYSDLFAKPERTSRGAEVTKQVLDVVGSVLAIGSSALGLAVTINGLRRSSG